MESIKLNFQNTDGKILYQNAVNNGPTNPGVREVPTNFDAYKTAGISYARNHDASFYNGYGGEFTVDVHRIFRNFDADENDPASYIFEPTDKYLQNTVNAGTKIFYRLGASIEHGYKFGTYPPKDFLKWARICEHIIRHYNEGWANGFEFDIEYWEIWNEPDCKNADGSNPCWQGTEQEFIDFYCTASTYLKEKFPNLKIGGPAFMSISSRNFVEAFLTQVSEKNAPLDFFSFHVYTREIKHFGETTDTVREILHNHGFYNTELILNEWNYIKGWRGELWRYSLDMERGLKGSSFIASAMSECQKHKLDMLMYYDARPCGMNGMFEHETFKPLKGYYPFVAFRDLLDLGTYIKPDGTPEDIYYCGATDGKNHAIMVSHYNDDDETDAKTVTIECENASGNLNAEYYILDENHDLELVREDFFTTEKFNIQLKMNLFTTYLIKFTEC